MGWLIGLGILALLAFIPLCIRGEYDAIGPRAWLQIGPWRYPLYPTPKRQRASGSSKQKKKPGKTQNSASGDRQDFQSVVSILWDAVKDLHKKLRVDLFMLKIVLADDDPADLAIKYGRTCSLVGGFLPQVEQVFCIKERDVAVSCDFTATQTIITAKLYISITVGRLLLLLLNHGFKFLSSRIQTTNQRKGGAKA